jgi:hypothetical protein
MDRNMRAASMQFSVFVHFISETIDTRIRTDQRILRQILAQANSSAQRVVVNICAAFRAWRHMKPKTKAIRNCGNAISMGMTVMDFLLAFISIGAAAWIFMRRFEQRLETQHGPWISEVEH